MADKDHTPPSPLQFIATLLPSLITLLGVGGLQSAGIVDIRDRYQWAADVLVWLSVAGIAIAIIAAAFPYLSVPPFSYPALAARHAARAVRSHNVGRRERRDFELWLEKWRDYSLLVFARFDEKTVGDWRKQQDKYRALRDWFIANQELLHGDVVQHVRRYLSRQWDDHTVLEERLGASSGIFPFIRKSDIQDQLIDMLVESRERGMNGTPRHLSHTFNGIWEGLSDYSILRGWSPLERLHSLTGEVATMINEAAPP